MLEPIGIFAVAAVGGRREGCTGGVPRLRADGGRNVAGWNVPALTSMSSGYDDAAPSCPVILAVPDQSLKSGNVAFSYGLTGHNVSDG